MKTAKPLIFISAVVFSMAAPAWAGDSRDSRGSNGSGEFQESPWTALAWKVHHQRDDRFRGVAFIWRAWGTFLHAPQILSETVEGDRAFVNKRGILAPRETPSEDRVYSPDE